MAGPEVLGERAGPVPDEPGEQTDAADMDGRVGPAKGRPRQDQRLRQGPDEDRGVHVRQHGSGHHGGQGVRREEIGGHVDL